MQNMLSETMFADFCSHLYFFSLLVIHGTHLESLLLLSKISAVIIFPFIMKIGLCLTFVLLNEFMNKTQVAVPVLDKFACFFVPYLA